MEAIRLFTCSRLHLLSIEVFHVPLSPSPNLYYPSPSNLGQMDITITTSFPPSLIMAIHYLTDLKNIGLRDGGYAGVIVTCLGPTATMCPLSG